MINFNKFYKLFNLISLCLVVASILLLFFKGLNFGVDFKGGTLIELRTNDKSINITSLRQSFDKMNVGDFSVKKFGNKTDDKKNKINFDKNIEFKDVNFSYEDGKKIFENINIEFNKGDKIGIFGDEVEEGDEQNEEINKKAKKKKEKKGNGKNK